MKKLSLLFVLLAFAFNVSASKVELEKAVAVAQFLMEQKFDANQIRGEELALAYAAQNPQSTEVPVAYYVFNVGETGFIIIAGNDVAYPILGYSTNGKYEHDNLPPNFQAWMEDIANAISGSVAKGILPTAEISEEWNAYLSRNAEYFEQTRGDRAVNPLIQTKWNQDNPYWNECPMYQGNRCYTGCVATAMAQLMKYYNYPAMGTGAMAGYNTKTLGISIPNTSFAVNYNFSNMGGATPTTTDQQANVAKLMYHCGVSVKMDYTPNWSSAYDQSVGNALTTYFGYDKAMRIEYKPYYSDTQWISMLKQELDANRPVYYSGRVGNDGHAFICDGYNASNLFHINWGWGGYLDGDYTVTPLADFPNANLIYLGLKPDAGGTTPNYQINLPYEAPNIDLVASQSIVALGVTDFSATARFFNAGWKDFPGGAYSMGLFNASGNLVILRRGGVVLGK